MLKLATTLAVVALAFPAWACDEPTAVRGYSYGAPAVRGAAAYGYAPAVAYYDDDYYDGYGYGYGGVGLAVGAGIARRAYWRNRWDNRPRLAHRASFRSAAIGGGIGRVGGGRLGGRR